MEITLSDEEGEDSDVAEFVAVDKESIIKPTVGDEVTVNHPEEVLTAGSSVKDNAEEQSKFIMADDMFILPAAKDMSLCKAKQPVSLYLFKQMSLHHPETYKRAT